MTKDVVAIIPARGGSKGIARKNILVVAGKPLLQWTIEAAQAATCVSRIIVSTEDAEIAALATMLGAEVPFLRPASLARDDTPGVDPILHLLEALQPVEPWTLVLQPTSPLRQAHDIDGARERAEQRGADAVLAVTAVRQHIAWQKHLDDDGWLTSPSAPPATRQALATRWCPTGAIYLTRTVVLRRERTLTPARTAAWEMPASRSLDIDVADDLVIAEALLGARHG